MLKIDFMNCLRNICCLSAIIIALLFSSCAGNNRQAVVVPCGDTAVMKHASLLTMVRCDSFTVVDVKNPWRNALLRRYLLVPKNEPLPENLPDGTVLRTPLDNMLVFSTVHSNLLKMMGRISAISGVCDAQYISVPEIRKGIANGTIVDCGSSLNVNIERIVSLSPEAVWVLPFENGGYGKIDKLDCPIIECVEYMEHSPLAAAEWMRFYGLLMGREDFADSLFVAVCDNFDVLRRKVAQADYRPSLMCELKSSGAWYMPSGGSTMGQMYAAAGADYLFNENEGGGSVPLSYETVLSRAANADFWLIKYNASVDKNYSSLLDDFRGYAHFKPFKEKKIYACNTGKTFFYEETPFRPDLLLQELVAIFHPELVNGYKLRYYEKME